MASGRGDSEGIRLISSAYSDDDDDDMEEAPNHQIDQVNTEEERVGNGSLMAGSQLQTDEGDTKEDTPPEAVHSLTIQETPKISERSLTPESHNVNYDVSESECSKMVEVVSVAAETSMDVELLNKFLPPPPKVKCSDELQKKIRKFLDLKRLGKSYNTAVRSKKEYRNPDFLLHAVTYQDIDQIGSCFSKDVLDPHGYDKSDYYDELEADMKREMESKEQERKKSPKVEFISGGIQPAVVGPAPKLSLPVPGVATLPSGGVHPVSVAVESVARDGRNNKKSKWDKVDDDQKNMQPSGRHSSVSAAAGHAALVSANAGSGYTAFAQKRRREAEERRLSEKRERRS